LPVFGFFTAHLSSGVAAQGMLYLEVIFVVPPPTTQALAI
jgi:hypothetical protein